MILTCVTARLFPSPCRHANALFKLEASYPLYSYYPPTPLPHIEPSAAIRLYNYGHDFLIFVCLLLQSHHGAIFAESTSRTAFQNWGEQSIVAPSEKASCPTFEQQPMDISVHMSAQSVQAPDLWSKKMRITQNRIRPTQG